MKRRMPPPPPPQTIPNGIPLVFPQLDIIARWMESVDARLAVIEKKGGIRGRVLDIEDVSKEYGSSSTTIRKLIREKKIKTFRVGNRIKILAESLEQFRLDQEKNEGGEN